jgi:phosphoglycolate phosphatase
MKTVGLMVFDFDGTLVDSLDDITVSVNAMLGSLGLDSVPKERVRSYVGDGIPMLVHRAIAFHREASAELVGEAVRIYLEHHEKHCLVHTRIYPGVEEVLRHFSSVRKVIVSNKQTVLTRTIAHALRLDHHFVRILGGDSMPFKKPDPRVVEWLCSEFNLKPSEIVIIGDGIQDVQCGRTAGALTCAVTYGFGDRSGLKEADFIIDDPTELRELFNAGNNDG